MRLSFYFLCVAAVLAGPPNTNAQSSKAGSPGEKLAPIVLSGLEAYKNKGLEEAVKAWIKGSGIDGSKEALAQANNLRQIEDYYGKYRS